MPEGNSSHLLATSSRTLSPARRRCRIRPAGPGQAQSDSAVADEPADPGWCRKCLPGRIALPAADESVAARLEPVRTAARCTVAGRRLCHARRNPRWQDHHHASTGPSVACRARARGGGALCIPAQRPAVPDLRDGYRVDRAGEPETVLVPLLPTLMLPPGSTPCTHGGNNCSAKRVVLSHLSARIRTNRPSKHY